MRQSTGKEHRTDDSARDCAWPESSPLRLLSGYPRLQIAFALAPVAQKPHPPNRAQDPIGDHRHDFESRSAVAARRNPRYSVVMTSRALTTTTNMPLGITMITMMITKRMPAGRWGDV